MDPDLIEIFMAVIKTAFNSTKQNFSDANEFWATKYIRGLYQTRNLTKGNEVFQVLIDYQPVTISMITHPETIILHVEQQ
jgi:hypothetical protein